jgi:hypothetical protein
MYAVVDRQSQGRPAVGQEQGGPAQATRRTEAGARPTPHTEDCRRRVLKAHKDVRWSLEGQLNLAC